MKHLKRKPIKTWMVADMMPSVIARRIRKSGGGELLTPALVKEAFYFEGFDVSIKQIQEAAFICESQGTFRVQCAGVC